MRLRVWALGLGILMAATLSACGRAEKVAAAAERAPQVLSCALGQMDRVQRCGGESASYHVCGRVDGADPACLQPARWADTTAQGSQRCVPIGALIDAGGYARIGDCPSGYCK